MALRVIFMGTPDFAVPSLDALVAAGHEIVAVYTQPPRRAGRGKAMSPSPVHVRADELGLVVRTPAKLRDPVDQFGFAALSADIAVVAAYGLILPRPVLEAPVLGCVNVHASLLPRWRGAAPIQRAILAGDSLTGITIMQMEAGLDTGPMLARAVTSIDHKTAGELTAELARMGAGLLVQTLANTPPPVVQPDTGVTYAAKVDKAEARLDFTLGAQAVERHVRAFAPTPGAWFEHGGERIRVLEAEVIEGGADAGLVAEEGLIIGCDVGLIRLAVVQRAGRAAMRAEDLLRGFAIPVGTVLA